jgi:hypothetical protein
LKRIDPLLASAIAAGAGFLFWLVFAPFSPHMEAWDGPLWWFVSLPVLAVTSGVLGYLTPERVWRWPLWIAAGELVAILLTSGGNIGLLPLAVIFVFVPLVVVFTILAIIGAMIAHRGWDSDIIR